MLQNEAPGPMRAPTALRRIALAAALLLGAPAAADPCEDAARAASQAHGVPLAVMRAVLRVETGEGRGTARRGWPWSANADGRSFRFDGPAEALAFARGPVARSAGNIDLGCFQISVRWHGERFSGPGEMLDPQRNALYAARLLRGHYEREGDWTRAAGAYHSRTETVASGYRDRFLRELAALRETGPTRLASARTRRPQPVFGRVAGLATPPPGARAVAPLPTRRSLEPVDPLPRRSSFVAAPLTAGARPLVEGEGAAPGSLVPATRRATPLLGRGWGS